MGRRAKCEHCGARIPYYTGPEKPVLCVDCCDDEKATQSRTVGKPSGANWENDPSGASSSWDNAVKRYESQ